MPDPRWRNVLVKTQVGLLELEEDLKANVRARERYPQAAANEFLYETLRTIAFSSPQLGDKAAQGVAKQALDFELWCRGQMGLDDPV